MNTDTENIYLDWDWIFNNKPADEMKFVKHLIFDEPILVKMNAHQKIGIITKPGVVNNGR